ncbi:hypothetical protein [Clostridium cavendishii]|uniref:hypothetical protein n=1 Tax=Clostridium cavendishii TaxID=349931 RepID=UPI0013564399|nr:hypothetical protein [Clostridium cavendishii]
MAKELLRNKESFIWNVANLRKENRQKLICLCMADNAKIKFVSLEVSYKELLFNK